MTHPTAEREHWIDTIRASACLMVILLHVAAFYVTKTDIQSMDWAAANIVDSATRVCVPLFFMITGYLFLGRRKPGPRHVFRVVASIFAYSILAIAYVWITKGYLPLNRILAMPYEPVFYHLWYLYALLGIYLIASLVTVRTPASVTAITALCILMLVLNDSGLAPEGSDLALGGNSIIYLLFAFAGFILGNILRTVDPSRTGSLRWASLATFCLSIAAIAYFTHKASLAANQFVGEFYNYTHPLVIIAALSCFSWLRLASPGLRLRAFFQRISTHSLAIYGVHALLLDLLRPIAGTVDHPAGIEMIWMFALVLTGSYLAALILRRADPRQFFT